MGTLPGCDLLIGGWRGGRCVGVMLSHTDNVRFLAIFLVSEVDRVLRAAQWRETKHLLHNFTGSVMDAQCSVQSDGDRIRAEITESGEELSVDNAVALLIQAGMSTPELQEIAGHGVNLSRAGYCKYSLVASGCSQWLYECVLLMYVNLNSWPWYVGLFGIPQVILFLILLACVPPDRRRFAADAVTTFVFFCYTVVSYAWFWGMCVFLPSLRSFTRNNEIHNTLMCILVFCLGPLTLVVSVLGPALLSRIPGIGLPLTRLIMANKSLIGSKDVSCYYKREGDSTDSSDVDCEDNRTDVLGYDSSSSPVSERSQ